MLSNSAAIFEHGFDSKLTLAFLIMFLVFPEIVHNFTILAQGYTDKLQEQFICAFYAEIFGLYPSFPKFFSGSSTRNHGV